MHKVTFLSLNLFFSSVGRRIKRNDAFSYNKDMDFFSFFSTKHTTSFINADVIFFGKFKLVYALITHFQMHFCHKCGFALEGPPVSMIRAYDQNPIFLLLVLSETFSAVLFLSYYLSCILSRALETVFKILFKSQNTLEINHNYDNPFTIEIEVWMS